jgi:hypothetical protein
MKWFGIVCVFALSYCASHALAQQTPGGSSPEPMSLCGVLKDAAKYDGKEIVVHGLFRASPHGSLLIDRACPKTDVNLRESPGYKTDKKAEKVIRSITKKDQFQPVEVVFRGIFHVAHVGQCFGENCAGYEIETTELISARPDSPPTGGVTSKAGGPPTASPD